MIRGEGGFGVLENTVSSTTPFLLMLSIPALTFPIQPAKVHEPFTLLREENVE